VRAAVVNRAGEVCPRMDSRSPFAVRLRYSVLEPLPSLRVCVRFLSPDGATAFQSCDFADPEWHDRKRPPGVYESLCELPGDLLNDGQYTISVSADIPYVAQLFQEESLLSVQIAGAGANAGRLLEPWPGVVCPSLRWTVQEGIGC
jgi:hypothetical protein